MARILRAFRRRATRPRTRKPLRRMRMYNRVRQAALPNIFKYKRYCKDSTLINTDPDNIKWVDAQSGWSLGTISPDDNGLVQFGGVMKFQLDDVINPTDFTALYDRYKITGVKITFIPLANQAYAALSTTGNSQTSTLPTIVTAIDYDDSGVPNNSLTLLEKMDSKVRRLDKPFSVYIKNPKVSSTVNAESGNVSAVISNAGYINTANDDVNFRGFKFYIRDMYAPDSAGKQNSLIRIQTKYYLKFKDPQ